MDTQNQTTDSILDGLRDLPGALLPILHAIQDELGHVPPAAVPAIARALNLSAAEVHGVIGFYPHFRQTPPARHVLRLCRAEACQAAGADTLAEHVQRALGCGLGETGAGGAVALEPAYCLGLCASAPALMVDEDEPHGRVTAAAVDALIARLCRP